MNSLRSIVSLTHRYEQKSSLPTTPIISSNLRLWLDASDPTANGVPPTSDTNLSSWSDKSQYKNNARALNVNEAGTSIPYLKTGFNLAYPTFNFSSSNTLANRFVNVASLSTTNSSITGTSTRAFIVGTLLNSVQSYSRFIGFSSIYKDPDSSISTNWAFTRLGAQGMVPFRNNAGVNNNPPSYNMPLIWEAWFDGTKGYSKFLNGTLTTEASFNSTGSFNINHFAIGCKTTGEAADRLVGNISEILVYDGQLTDTEVNHIEAYLAYKWGLSATLPLTNPYRPQ